MEPSQGNASGAAGGAGAGEEPASFRIRRPAWPAANNRRNMPDNQNQTHQSNGFIPMSYVDFDSFNHPRYDQSSSYVSPDELNFSGLAISDHPYSVPYSSPAQLPNHHPYGYPVNGAYPYDPMSLRVNSAGTYYPDNHYPSLNQNQNAYHYPAGLDLNQNAYNEFDIDEFGFDPYAASSFGPKGFRGFNSAEVRTPASSNFEYGRRSRNGNNSYTYNMPHNPTRIFVPPENTGFYDQSYAGSSLHNGGGGGYALRNGGPYNGKGGGCRSRWYGNVTLDEMRGKMVMAAKDHYGCVQLQRKIDEGSRDDLKTIFSEVKDYVRELMVHPSGNYLIQRFCEVFDEQQMNQLVLLVTGDDRMFMSICLDFHGTRAMQKMIEHVKTVEQRSRITSALRRITLPLTKNMNGHHIIRSCLERFPTEDMMQILNVVADNFLDVAIDKCGCVVLQHCVNGSTGETLDRLVSQIIAEAATLSEDPYGNYVVQYLLHRRIRFATQSILQRLFGRFVYLSTNKYGSNVVEKCLNESIPDLAALVIQELIYYPQEFMMIVQNPYGNYVVQTALSAAKGGLKHRMIEMIQSNYANLHSHPHGKRVLARTKAHNRYHHRHHHHHRM